MTETDTFNRSAEPTNLKAKRDRSPSFPFISLQSAINRLVAFEEHFKRYPAPAKHSGSAWGMKGWTSQAQQTLAALKAFGLVEYQGSGEALSASITEDGRTYLRAQQEKIKKEVLKRLALKPKNLARYFELWGADRPPDAVCLDQLILKGGFTEGSAKLFLSVYDATIGFAGLASNDSVCSDHEEEEEETSSAEPPRGNLPMLHDTANMPAAVSRRPMAYITQGTREDNFNLPEGIVTLSFPEHFSQESYDDLKAWLEFQQNRLKRWVRTE